MHKKIIMLFVGVALGFLVGCATIGHGLVGTPRSPLLTEKESLLSVPDLKEDHEEILDEHENRTGIWKREGFDTYLILCNGTADQTVFRAKEKFIEETFGVRIVQRLDFESSEYATSGLGNNVKMGLLKNMVGFKGQVLRTTKMTELVPMEEEKPVVKKKKKKFSSKRKMR
jgi:hypothetical protein